MIFSSSEVLPIAESTGFRAEMIEKVLHLLNLLDKLKIQINIFDMRNRKALSSSPWNAGGVCRSRRRNG